MGGEPASEIPAVIDQPSTSSRDELQKVVSTVVGSRVTLAPDALTQDSTLSIERAVARDSGSRRIDVREVSGPEIFRLIKRGEQCVLVHERTKTETVLNAATCKAR